MQEANRRERKQVGGTGSKQVLQEASRRDRRASRRDRKQAGVIVSKQEGQEEGRMDRKQEGVTGSKQV